MIILLKPGLTWNDPTARAILAHCQHYSGVTLEVQELKTAPQSLCALALSGNTASVSSENLKALPGVLQVIRLSHSLQKLAATPDTPFSFEYQGVRFSQDDFHCFFGLNAVDSPKHVETMMRTLQAHGLNCTRMGAYKPRTSPYSFSGKGAACLPYVFELAGKYDIRIIAMEITHPRHLEEIHQALTTAGNPTGVMLQTGTRNAQNFELLKAVGEQTIYPILYKRGFGISLQESIAAAEHIAAAGNERIIFCLRGVKSIASEPHRNLVDFAQVPTLKRLIKSPVCVDPSHAIGLRTDRPQDGLCDIFHASSQGIIAGANMLLVDFHPNPPEALVDSRQAIGTDQLSWFLEDVSIARKAYLQRTLLAQKYNKSSSAPSALHHDSTLTASAPLSL